MAPLGSSPQAPPPTCQAPEPLRILNCSLGGSLTTFGPTSLPPGVCVIPVYLLEDEAAALRELPVEWMTR